LGLRQDPRVVNRLLEYTSANNVANSSVRNVDSAGSIGANSGVRNVDSADVGAFIIRTADDRGIPEEIYREAIPYNNTSDENSELTEKLQNLFEKILNDPNTNINTYKTLMPLDELNLLQIQLRNSRDNYEKEYIRGILEENEYNIFYNDLLKYIRKKYNLEFGSKRKRSKRKRLRRKSLRKSLRRN
jgi:hypothetical protein